MAKVVAPALSLRASGNVGAINYLEWRGSAVARMKNPAVQPNTSAQVAQQTNMIAAAKAWSTTLTVEERLAWEELAREIHWSDKLGLKWTPSGYQYYMKLSTQALAIGGSIQLLPPMPIPSAYPETAELEYVGTTPKVLCRLSDYPPLLAPDLIQVFRAGPYDGGGRTAIEPEYRQLGTEITPFEYSDATITATKWYWYKMRWGFLSGVVGNWFKLQIHCI